MFRILLSLVLAGSLSAQVSYYVAALDGAQEVPPVATNGGGYAVVRLQEPANTVRIFVHYYGLTTTPTAGHLHAGTVGSNGPVVVGLGAPVGNGTFVGTGTLTAAEASALKTGGHYINVHTPAVPSGELRGQVVSANSTRFNSTLDGSQEVPATTSAATGSAIAFLHEPDNRLVYCVETTGMPTINAAHLHFGAVGNNGPILAALNGGAAGTFCGVTDRLTAAEMTAITSGATYFNIHTPTFPGGEIRGQLLRDAGSDFAARCNGSEEVPPVATTGVATAALHIDKNGALTIEVSHTGLTGTLNAAHIHNAPFGSNGPVVLGLTPSGSKFVGVMIPTPAQLAQLRNGDWYVNLHTSGFPSGEVRGQLRGVNLPETFGPSCASGTGTRLEIGATRFPAIGAGVDIDLYGATPGSVGFLALGFNRDLSGLGALPLAFPAIGLNAPCFVLVDPVSSLLNFADGNGCATQSLSFGFVPGLTGLQVYGQWFVADPAANPAGLAASNGLELVLL